MTLHRRFLLGELSQTRRQGVIFILCVALSLTSLVSLNSFKESIHRSLLADARALHGGDIILHSHQPFTPALLKAVAGLSARQTVAQQVATYEFYSVVRGLSGEGSLLANVKVVGRAYPLHGRVVLQSGRTFSEVMGPGRAVVEQELLDRLHLRMGDSLRLGSGALTVVDVVTHEPDRPLTLFSLGPRVLVSEADLDRVDLIKKGSRVDYRLRLTVVDQAKVEGLAAELQAQALAGQERVETFRTARSGVKRFFDNLLFFLSLIGIFTLLLAGIGMQSALIALLRERERTIAIAKALGATNGFLLRHYLLIVLFLGLVGSGLGVLAATLLAGLFPRLFSGVVPSSLALVTSLGQVGAGLLLGLAVVLLFTYLPLSRLSTVKPVAIFRSEKRGRQQASFYLALGLGLIFLTGLVIHQLAEVRTGLAFMAGASLLIVLTALLTRWTFALLARITVTTLTLRQALRSLFRPGNASRSIIVTLAAALALLLSIHLVEENLDATFVASYPADAPNLFCLDIQPDQKEGFTRLLPVPAQLHPVIRARLTAINHAPIDRQAELGKRSDNLAREFNLTYRGKLLEDERLLAGDALFRREWQETETVQVSILDTVAEMGDMAMGDLLEFNIQGVPLLARVTSIRTRSRSRLYPFFYFVFAEEVLRSAPQTWFAALTVEASAIPKLENRIVAAFPNISVINMAATAADLGALLKRLTTIINFFALFSVLAGALIVVSSVFATRAARMREAVYYKILGATTSFVLRVMVYENMLIGLISAGLAVLLAQAGSWALCRFWLDIPYQPRWPACLTLMVGTTLLVIGVGLISSIPILRHKPSHFLREQADS